jgi:hypothetical protein
VTGAVRANVFVHLRDQHVETPKTVRPHCRKGQILQVQAPLDEIPAIAAKEGVTYVEIAEALKMPVVTTADDTPAQKTSAAFYALTKAFLTLRCAVNFANCATRA